GVGVVAALPSQRSSAIGAGPAGSAEWRDRIAPFHGHRPAVARQRLECAVFPRASRDARGRPPPTAMDTVYDRAPTHFAAVGSLGRAAGADRQRRGDDGTARGAGERALLR